MKINLPSVTLLGIDCLDIERLSIAMNVSQKNIQFGATKLLSSLKTEDKRLITIPEIKTVDAYSLFCIKSLLEYVETENALIVQHDGFILNPNTWRDDFLEYDYIGAPWLVEDWLINDYHFPKKLLGRKIVGNGGFSLRSRKFLEVGSWLYGMGKLPQTNPEDIAQCVWYRDLFEKEGIKFAPIELAEKFSIEGENFVYSNQFGFHSYVWTDISAWVDKHSELEGVVKAYQEGKNIRKQITYSANK